MVSGNLNLFTALSGDTIYIPQIGYLKCEASPQSKSSSIEFGNSGNSLLCGVFEQTSSCLVKVTDSSTGLLGDRFSYKKCTVDKQGNDISCSGSLVVDIGQLGGSSGPVSVDLPSLNSGEKYFLFNAASIGGGSKIMIARKTYNEWLLNRYSPGTGFTTVRTGSCNLVGVDSSRILKSEKDQVLDNELRADKFGQGKNYLNYFEAFVASTRYNVVTYQGQKRYCLAPNIYEINEVVFSDGSVRKLEPRDFTSSSSDSIRATGNIVANVECCYEIDPNCGSDFKFSSTTQPVSCVSNVQCQGAGYPIATSTTTAIRYNCVAGKCQSEQVSVECTDSSACSPGQTCDLSITNYGKCIMQPTGIFCGDGRCDQTEDKVNCPADCAAPGQGGSCSGIKISHTSTPNFIQKLFGARENTTQTCVANTSIILIVIGLIILALVFGLVKRRRR